MDIKLIYSSSSNYHSHLFFIIEYRFNYKYQAIIWRARVILTSSGIVLFQPLEIDGV